MARARRILRWLAMLFLVAATLSGLFGQPGAMVAIIYVLAPVAIAYVTLGVLRYMGRYSDPRPQRMADPYWPPSRRRGGARR